MTISYKKAGVDIDAGNLLVEKIKKMAPRIGGFSDGMELPKGVRNPMIVGCTDGVGTKLVIAHKLDKHDTIGYDLVGMNVNDLICSGAQPMFFLDYFACGKLDVGVAETVVRSITNACKESDCELLGGETAEMPGFYKPGEYDLAGFAVGVVDKKKQLRPKDTVKSGDVLIGLPSSGPHSNGYSLIRKIFKPSEWKKHAEWLLAPTKLYVRPVLKAIKALNKKEIGLKGLVHITGGGFYDNIPRILPANAAAVIRKGSWPVLPIFEEMQRRESLPDAEMFRTFNMGLGMIAACRPDAVDEALRLLPDSLIVGTVEPGKQDVRFV